VTSTGITGCFNDDVDDDLVSMKNRTVFVMSPPIYTTTSDYSAQNYFYFYGSRALCCALTVSFLSFLIQQTVGKVHWRGGGSAHRNAPLSTLKTTKIQGKKNRNFYLDWDLNPQPQLLIGRRKFMP
jgi:hypothetical protein